MDVNAWQEIKKFTGIVRLSNPHIVWIWGGYGITNALSPFITLYYSAEILNQLIAEAYTTAFQTALLMCTGVLICSLLAKAFYNRLQVICRTAVMALVRLTPQSRISHYAVPHSVRFFWHCLR